MYKALILTLLALLLTACGTEPDSPDSAVNEVAVSPSDSSLDPSPLRPPTQVSLRFVGHFSYFADAALFRDCFTHYSLPVMMEQDYLALERAYLGLITESMEPVLAEVRGRVAWREAMEGPDRPQLIVEQFIGLEKEADCPAFSRPPPLQETYWRPIRLGEVAIGELPPGSDPYLLLFGGANGRFAATVGCNRMMGSLSQQGEGLQFGPAASTLMGCPEPFSQLERELVQVLAATQRYRYQGDRLQLIDQAEQVVADWLAIYQPSAD